MRAMSRENVTQTSGANTLWFIGFIGALLYYLHAHSGTFWLIILAILKSAVWPAILVYNLFLFLGVK